MLQPIKTIAFITIGILPSLSIADLPSTHHIYQIVTTECLLKRSQAEYHTLANAQSFSLIETNQVGLEKLIEAKEHRSNSCGGFMNVSANWSLLPSQSPSKQKATNFLANYIKLNSSESTSKTDYKIQYPEQVNALYKQINTSAMWNNLTTFSSFADRYARSENGLKAAQWIKSTVETIAKDTGHDDVTVYFINTGTNYLQPSVVAKIGTSSEAGVVIGAHMDTLNGKKPGADDDGSGSMTILETARTLLASGISFKKPIYFIWYAAEEQGMVGSGYVVSEFKQKHIPIAAVMHFDMTGFAYRNDPTIWLMKDYVNKDLTDFIATLIHTYVKQPVNYTTCGYACSDHATWYREGFATSLPAEAAFENTNPVMHSSQDTIDKLSPAHMTDYVKTALAFAVELAEPSIN